jgi:hypothetical protein
MSRRKEPRPQPPRCDQCGGLCVITPSGFLACPEGCGKLLPVDHALRASVDAYWREQRRLLAGDAARHAN